MQEDICRRKQLERPAGSGEIGVESGQLFVVAVVAGVVDDRAGGVAVIASGGDVVGSDMEVSVPEVGVGFVEAEFTAYGEREGFREIGVSRREVVSVDVERGSGEEA